MSAQSDSKQQSGIFDFYGRNTLLVFLNIVGIYGTALVIVHIIIPWCKNNLEIRSNGAIGYRRKKKFGPRRTPLLLLALREEERVKSKLTYFARRSVGNLIDQNGFESPVNPWLSEHESYQLSQWCDKAIGSATPMPTPSSGEISAGDGPDMELMSIALKRPKTLQ
ncbi:hypothetical protein RRG08_012709 [Elysia crispata]|uniref:Uncharacterized protein n=1 Tax=Elysia crispata TaxID=231223 RepID=A0AAE0ZWB2_9GAST|nr:hypothetical protein RRG08_012709 [Elysia crispata]